MPGYNWCGPGTDVAKAGEPINSLDACCRIHDLVYDSTDDVDKRVASDKRLQKCALEIQQRAIIDSDTKLAGEASLVALAMALEPGRFI